MDAQKLGFSDIDEDATDVDALLDDVGRPEVHPILPLCPLTFLVPLAYIVSLFLKSEIFTYASSYEPNVCRFYWGM